MLAKPSKAKKKLAFVAMRFEGNGWNDPRYLSIAEVLSEAGYEPIRSDQIQSSGSVVDEVCSYLKNAPLVVIDSTGDSHSVSYEIGYCHGVKRDPAKTILIRQGDGKDIPFNYRHFRHKCYKTPKHLKGLLRECLGLSSPLTDDQCGYAFTFDVPQGATNYTAFTKQSVLETIQYFDFSGRCEFYENDGYLGDTHFYFVALGLKFHRTKKPTPDYNWWMKFYDRVKIVVEQGTALKLSNECSEMAEMRAIRKDITQRGIYEFYQGKKYRFIETELVEQEADILDALSP